MSTPIARAAYFAFAGCLACLPFTGLAQVTPDNHTAGHVMANAPAENVSGDSIDKTSSDKTPSDKTPGMNADATTSLSPIVVTAQRGAQPLADAIAQTTSFDQQDLADTTATDLPGLLQLAPGAQIARTGGPGSAASLMLRGAS
jgi:vitamin B12 transporter